AQGLDGSNPLQDPDPRQGPNGDEPSRPGLQSETRGSHARPTVADRGDPGLNVLRSLTPKHKPVPAPTFRCAATAAFSHSLGHSRRLMSAVRPVYPKQMG